MTYGSLGREGHSAREALCGCALWLANVDILMTIMFRNFVRLKPKIGDEDRDVEFDKISLTEMKRRKRVTRFDPPMILERSGPQDGKSSPSQETVTHQEINRETPLPSTSADTTAIEVTLEAAEIITQPQKGPSFISEANTNKRGQRKDEYGILQDGQTGKHGNRKKWSGTDIDSIKRHIESFRQMDIHYCRKESVKGYLDQSLSINEMYRQYQKKCNEEEVASREKYHVFTEQYNL
ncbi:H-2 class ii histocompatibility antigen, e-q beta chain [Plakobranchus ocellatus]|uniref:H-2 class ii histocompatibility antigen, e-q beta chain n=1 Tax=Plakobranchus ocellatus TaxID=259542 RepID=A0AAV3YTD5_9GAST|nr:H-2 class ii histocompatibility antigen, e-q beta chain [Plakobranchus ocellatus]